MSRFVTIDRNTAYLIKTGHGTAGLALAAFESGGLTSFPEGSPPISMSLTLMRLHDAFSYCPALICGQSNMPCIHKPWSDLTY